MKSANSTPGYMQIRRYVYSLIASASGDEAVNCKLTTEQELCKIFSMSTGTVRKALDALVAEGLLLRRPRHGTFINPSVLKLHHQSSYVGIIIGDGNACVYDPFIMMELCGIFESLSERGHLSQLINFAGASGQNLLGFALDKSSGVIWLQPGADKLEMIKTIRDQLHIPIVLVNPLFATDEFQCVRIDYEQMGFLTTQKLLSLGHRNILFLDSNCEIQFSHKRDGARTAFAAAGIPWRVDRFITGSALALMDNLDQLLVKHADCTVISCSGALQETVRKKITLDHLPVQLVGNNHLDNDPALCPVRVLVSLETMGRMAVELLREAGTGPALRLLMPHVESVL